MSTLPSFLLEEPFLPLVPGCGRQDDTRSEYYDSEEDLQSNESENNDCDHTKQARRHSWPPQLLIQTIFLEQNEVILPPASFEGLVAEGAGLILQESLDDNDETLSDTLDLQEPLKNHNEVLTTTSTPEHVLFSEVDEAAEKRNEERRKAEEQDQMGLDKLNKTIKERRKAKHEEEDLHRREAEHLLRLEQERLQLEQERNERRRQARAGLKRIERENLEQIRHEQKKAAEKKMERKQRKLVEKEQQLSKVTSDPKDVDTPLRDFSITSAKPSHTSQQLTVGVEKGGKQKDTAEDSKKNDRTLTKHTHLTNTNGLSFDQGAISAAATGGVPPDQTLVNTDNYAGALELTSKATLTNNLPQSPHATATKDVTLEQTYLRTEADKPEKTDVIKHATIDTTIKAGQTHSIPQPISLVDLPTDEQEDSTTTMRSLRAKVALSIDQQSSLEGEPIFSPRVDESIEAAFTPSLFFVFGSNNAEDNDLLRWSDPNVRSSNYMFEVLLSRKARATYVKIMRENLIDFSFDAERTLPLSQFKISHSDVPELVIDAVVENVAEYVDAWRQSNLAGEGNEMQEVIPSIPTGKLKDYLVKRLSPLAAKEILNLKKKRDECIKGEFTEWIVFVEDQMKDQFNLLVRQHSDFGLKMESEGRGFPLALTVNEMQKNLSAIALHCTDAIVAIDLPSWINRKQKQSYRKKLKSTCEGIRKDLSEELEILCQTHDERGEDTWNVAFDLSGKSSAFPLLQRSILNTPVKFSDNAAFNRDLKLVPLLSDKAGPSSKSIIPSSSRQWRSPAKNVLQSTLDFRNHTLKVSEDYIKEAIATFTVRQIKSLPEKSDTSCLPDGIEREVREFQVELLRHSNQEIERCRTLFLDYFQEPPPEDFLEKVEEMYVGKELEILQKIEKFCVPSHLWKYNQMLPLAPVASETSSVGKKVLTPQSSPGSSPTRANHGTRCLSTEERSPRHDEHDAMQLTQAAKSLVLLSNVGLATSSIEGPELSRSSSLSTIRLDGEGLWCGWGRDRGPSEPQFPDFDAAWEGQRGG